MDSVKRILKGELGGWEIELRAHRWPLAKSVLANELFGSLGPLTATRDTRLEVESSNLPG